MSSLANRLTLLPPSSLDPGSYLRASALYWISIYYYSPGLIRARPSTVLTRLLFWSWRAGGRYSSLKFIPFSMILLPWDGVIILCILDILVLSCVLESISVCLRLDEESSSSGECILELLTPNLLDCSVGSLEPYWFSEPRFFLNEKNNYFWALAVVEKVEFLCEFRVARAAPKVYPSDFDV